MDVCVHELAASMPMTEVFQHVRSQYESKPPPREAVGPGHAKVSICNAKNI